MSLLSATEALRRTREFKLLHTAARTDPAWKRHWTSVMEEMVDTLVDSEEEPVNVSVCVEIMWSLLQNDPLT